MMLAIVRWFLFFHLLCFSTAFAHNKVVVVPLLGDGSSHQHPEMEYLNLSASAFVSNSGAGGYRYDNAVLTTDAGDYLFHANLPLPHGVRIKTLTAIYRDGDTAADVRVQLFVSRYSNLDDTFNIAEVSSAGFSFGLFTRKSFTNIGLFSGYNPVDSLSNAYYIQLLMRNGAALRGVIVGYTTTVD